MVHRPLSLIQRLSLIALKYGMYGKSSWYIAYTVGVRYSECPLKEVPLYTSIVRKTQSSQPADSALCQNCTLALPRLRDFSVA